MRKILAGIGVSLGLAVLLFPFAKSILQPEPSGSTKLLPTRPYEMANRLELVDPPAQAFRQEVLRDLSARIVSRLEWGKPDVRYYTYRHLPSDKAALARRIEERLSAMSGVSGGLTVSLSALPLIEALGVVADEGSIELLLGLAMSPPDYVQEAAVKALGQLPPNEQIDLVMAELSADTNERVAKAAEQAALNRLIRDEGQSFLRPWMLDLLRGARDDAVVPVLDRVFRESLEWAVEEVPRHLQSESIRTRQFAIKALLRLGSEQGKEAAREELEAADDTRVAMGLSMYRDARVLPPLDRAGRLVSHRANSVRLSLAQALGPTESETEEEDDGAIRILEQLATDGEVRISRDAILSLFRRNHFAFVQPIRERLARAHGAELKEAAQFLCEDLKDPLAAEIIRRRLVTPLDTQDEANLLFGLRFVGAAEDVPHFVRRILEAGTDADRLAGTLTYLSEYSAQYVTNFQAAAAEPLTAALQRATTSLAKLELLDAIRGVAKHCSAATKEHVLSLIANDAEPIEVRIAAVDTLTYFEDPDLGERMLKLSDDTRSVELATRIRTIFLSYF